MWELVLSTVSIVKEFRNQHGNFLIALLSRWFAIRRNRDLGSWQGMEMIFEMMVRQEGGKPAGQLRGTQLGPAWRKGF